MAARRANGEGTIYKRKDGRYEASIFLRTTTGSLKRVRTYAQTRQEVHAKLIELKAKAQHGVFVPEKDWKLGEFLDHWLEHAVRSRRRPLTYRRHEVIVRLCLKPALGKHTLTRLSIQIVQAYLDQQYSAGQSAAHVHQVRKVLSAALAYAQRQELVVRNVARLVELPNYKPAETRPWTAGEAQQFLDVARSDPLYPAFALLILYGLRLGEVLGLRWCDVDFEQDVLSVRQQVQRIDDQLQQVPLKTEAGRRDGPLVDTARVMLDEQRARQAAARQLAADAWQGTGTDRELVFTTRTGRPVEPRNLYRSFQRICAQHGLRRITVHGLRHTNITLQKNLRVPDRDIQVIVGHADVHTTQSIYQHVDMTNQRDALEKVEGLFWRTVGSLHCRQLLPSSHQIVERLTTFLSGGPSGIRTHDTWLKSSIDASIHTRATEVKAVLDARRKQWQVGAVAVSAAVKFDSTVAM